MGSGGAAGPAQLGGSPGRGQHLGNDPASPLLSPSKELPSESTWHPAAETPLGTTEAAAAAAPPAAPAGSGAVPFTPEVTVLIGGIHAIHRQKSLQRAAGGSGAARRPSWAAAAVAEAPAAAGGGGSTGAVGGSAGLTRQVSGVPLPAVMAHRPGHARQPSMVPPTPGLPLCEDELGEWCGWVGCLAAADGPDRMLW